MDWGRWEGTLSALYSHLETRDDVALLSSVHGLQGHSSQSLPLYPKARRETWRGKCGVLYDPSIPTLSGSTGKKFITTDCCKGGWEMCLAGLPDAPLPGGDQLPVSDSDPFRCVRSIFSIKLLAP